MAGQLYLQVWLSFQGIGGRNQDVACVGGQPVGVELESHPLQNHRLGLIGFNAANSVHFQAFQGVGALVYSIHNAVFVGIRELLLYHHRLFNNGRFFHDAGTGCADWNGQADTQVNVRYSVVVGIPQVTDVAPHTQARLGKRRGDEAEGGIGITGKFAGQVVCYIVTGQATADGYVRREGFAVEKPVAQIRSQGLLVVISCAGNTRLDNSGEQLRLKPPVLTETVTVNAPQTAAVLISPVTVGLNVRPQY